MFTSGRYVIVDDERDQLRLLVDSLHAIGAPCVGVHYTGKPLDRAAFAGVRVLFSDLFLLQGVTQPMLQYAALEGMLRANVDPATGGPYLLIIWTTHDEKVEGLRDYLRERLDPALRPLAVLTLDKNDFLDGQPGLAAAVHERVNSSPQVRALVAWEADVLAAAGATLAAVTDLIPAEQRDVDGFSALLDGVLSRLAVAYAGRPNVEPDRRGAINGALVPILADRIANAPARPELAGIWGAAITKHQALPAIDDVQAGRMNRMLHVAIPPAEPVSSTDWGAALLLPGDERADGPMLERFGMKYPELLSQVFRVQKADRVRCTPVLVRVGAVCDFAQRKPGPLPYLLGLIVPADIAHKDIVQLKSEIASPLLLLKEADGPVRLLVNARFQISLVSPPAKFTPLFRVREQLLTTIIAHAGEYQTRPGVVKLPE
ncbi:MAG TPA: hypothetical protein VGC56_07260 [Allosphingosinicella sp.]|jgi:hypothetical protein